MCLPSHLQQLGLGEGRTTQLLLDTRTTDSGKREVWSMVLWLQDTSSLLIQNAKFYLYPNNLPFNPKKCLKLSNKTDLLMKGEEW